jgi:hypothetical protein
MPNARTLFPARARDSHGGFGAGVWMRVFGQFWLAFWAQVFPNKQLTNS